MAHDTTYQVLEGGGRGRVQIISVTSSVYTVGPTTTGLSQTRSRAVTVGSWTSGAPSAGSTSVPSYRIPRNTDSVL